TRMGLEVDGPAPAGEGDAQPRDRSYGRVHWAPHRPLNGAGALFEAPGITWDFTRPKRGLATGSSGRPWSRRGVGRAIARAVAARHAHAGAVFVLRTGPALIMNVAHVAVGLAHRVGVVGREPPVAKPVHHVAAVLDAGVALRLETRRPR